MYSFSKKAIRISVGQKTCYFCKRYGSSVSTSVSRASAQLKAGGPARTRFAPSPTGYLHLGSLRTALFNYLIAKATGGQFILRIEDTDRKRLVHDAEDKLFADLEWAGINWDEGPKIYGPFGPYRQSERSTCYKDHVSQLLASGHAYRCFCSPERLESLAQHQSKIGLQPEYDRECANISKEISDDRSHNGEAHVVRLKAPDRYPDFRDLVYGQIRQKRDTKHSNQGILSARLGFDDPILLKSDGFPTYHLANVVDDHLMKITHVIRGSEWMSSTPKHLAIYQAFGWETPEFGHVGLLLDKQGQKLSKRDGSLQVSSLRNDGVFPEALVNFVALLGWSHRERSDVMTMSDLVRNASMKFTKGDTIVSFEKLWFLQKSYAARYATATPINESSDRGAPTTVLELAVKPISEALGNDLKLKPNSHQVSESIRDDQARERFISAVLHADAKNFTTKTEFILRNKYFWDSPTKEALEESISKFMIAGIPKDECIEAMAKHVLSHFERLNRIPEDLWEIDELKSCTNAIIDACTESINQGALGIPADASAIPRQALSKLVHQYLRWATFGGMPGIDSATTMKILGKTETIKRLELAKALFKK